MLSQLNARVRELNEFKNGMITQDAARAKVEALVNQPDPYWPDRPHMVVRDELTLERPYGWIFFYHVPAQAVVGNGPVLVTRAEGEVHMLGTGLPLEEYLERFERTGDPHREPAP